MGEQKKALRKSLLTAIIALLFAIVSISTATFAWYIYQFSSHTTKVQMVAGTDASLLISRDYDNNYKSSTQMEQFSGFLSPVSTSSLINGSFNKMLGWDNSSGTFMATIFKNATPNANYYKTSLFLKTVGGSMDVFLSNIGFEDSDENNPISSAIRVGIVPHKPGEDELPEKEFIFEISDKKNPLKGYNTILGSEGDVIEKIDDDGNPKMKRITTYNKDNYCVFDKLTGEVSLKDRTVKICEANSTTPLKVDVYIWLEGCDEDCIENINKQTLKNLSISFAGIDKQ